MCVHSANKTTSVKKIILIGDNLTCLNTQIPQPRQITEHSAVGSSVCHTVSSTPDLLPLHPAASVFTHRVTTSVFDPSSHGYFSG